MFFCARYNKNLHPAFLTIFVFYVACFGIHVYAFFGQLLVLGAKERVYLRVGFEVVLAKRKRESFVAAYFALLILNLAGLTLQCYVLILIGSACLFCITTIWFGSNNYRYRTKYLKKYHPRLVAI